MTGLLIELHGETEPPIAHDLLEANVFHGHLDHGAPYFSDNS